ncbi:MAG: hypothetical protein M0006_14585 [Magnetospirillum sp.]|nr:hypothetical protein [Magnetospirillum sp.]
MSRGRAIAGLFNRLVGPIGRLTGGAAAPPPSAVAAGPLTERLTDEAFRLAMESLAKEEDGKFRTRLHVVSLIEFREAVGDKWGRLADKVLLIADGVIHQHLGGGNLSTRPGGDFFVLVFRTCLEPEARRRTRAIAGDLGTRLVGDQLVGLDRPQILSLDVMAADAVKDDGSLDLAAIEAAIDAHRASRARRPRETGPGQAAEASLPTSPTALRSPVDGDAIGEPGWEAAGSGSKGGDDPEWQRAASAAAAVAGQGVPPLGSGTHLSVVWRPTWLAAADAIAGYHARIVRSDGDADVTREGADAYPPDAASCAVLDRAAVADVARVLTARMAADSVSVILSLHWHTVSSVQRSVVAGALSNLGVSSRSSRLLIEIFGVPAGTSRRDLSDTVGAVRSLSRQVALRLRPGDDPLLGMAARGGVSMVGIDIGARADGRGVPAGLAWLRDGAGKARLPAYVWGVQDRSHLVFALENGFAMINGPALKGDQPRPASVLSAPKARLLDSGA